MSNDACLCWANLTEKVTSDDGRRQSLRVHSASRVLYNRVPKCGSEAVLYVLQELASRNKFRFVRAQQYLEYNLTVTEQVGWDQGQDKVKTRSLSQCSLKWEDVRNWAGLGKKSSLFLSTVMYTFNLLIISSCRIWSKQCPNEAILSFA